MSAKGFAAVALPLGITLVSIATNFIATSSRRLGIPPYMVVVKSKGHITYPPQFVQRYSCYHQGWNDFVKTMMICFCGKGTPVVLQKLTCS